MREVYPRLFVGDLSACRSWRDRLLRPDSGVAIDLAHHRPAMLHACKDPCHVKAVGARQLPKTDQEYLVAVRGEHQEHLVLNMIDPDQPLFQVPMFTAALDFLDRHYEQTPGGVIIHCNMGVSRSPSLALLWLAKRRQALGAAERFEDAQRTYLRLDPDFYAPGKGLVTFLTQHWAEIA